MKQPPSDEFSRRDYFNVPQPWHFRCRPDLMEELGIADEFERTWPRTENEHRSWCRTGGLVESDLPFLLLAQADRPYKLSRRCMLVRSILPNSDRVECLVMDALGWSVRCEPALAEFVFDRARAFLVTRGVRESVATEWLKPKSGYNADACRRLAACGVGYEAGTGLCSVIMARAEDAQRRFTTGWPGYFVPKF